MATEQQIVTASLAIANGALPLTTRAYEPSKVPKSKPDEFVTVTIARRSGGTPRAGRYATTGWALYVMAASKTSESNARNSLEKVGAALEGRVLTVAGLTSTPVKFQVDRPVGPDDGWSTGVKTYHFTL
jgi:hypothetical protein